MTTKIPSDAKKSAIDTSAHRARDRAALLVLDAALALGIHIGVSPDAAEVLLVAPLRVPYAMRRGFEILIEQFRAEVVDIIQRENLARKGGRA